MVSHLYTNKNVKIKSEFVEELKSKYKAIAKSLDFSKPETVDEINQQISDSTDGLVRGALTQLNPTAFSVMVNSIYFKGEWEYPFSEELNFQHPFKKSDGTLVDSTFMAHRNILAAIKIGTGHLNYLALSYVGGDLKLVIEMTKDKVLGAHNPDDVLSVATQKPSMCEVYIPKFKSVFSCDLLPVLRKLGIQRIFAASKEFSKITDHQMCISSIVHNACIQVDERGTEAFCFTMAEEFGEGDSGIAIPKFVADRPFFFHLVDVRNKIVLFSGTLEEPRF
jgi:serine protease inhibitor